MRHEDAAAQRERTVAALFCPQKKTARGDGCGMAASPPAVEAGSKMAGARGSERCRCARRRRVCPRRVARRVRSSGGVYATGSRAPREGR